MLRWLSESFTSLLTFDKTQLRKGIHKVAPFYLLKPISLLISFVTISRITALVGVEGYGVVSLILAATAFVSTVIDFRSNESVVRFRVRYLNEGAYGHANFCVLLGTGIDVILALLYPLIIFVFADPMCGNFFNGKIDKELLLIYAVSSSFLFLAGTPSAILQSKNMFWKLSSVDLFHKSIRLVWVLLVAGPFTVRDVILGYALSNVLYGLVMAALSIHALKIWSSVFPVHPSRVVASEVIKFAGQTFVSSLLKAGITDVDKLVIGYFCQTRDVGLYDIVKRIAGLLSWIIFPLGTVAYPMMVKLFQERRFSDIRYRIRKITLAVVFVSMVSAIVVLMAKDIVQHYFNISGVPILQVLVPLLLCNILQNTLWFSRAFVNSIGEPQISIWLNATMSVASIALLLLFVSFLGVNGAALANLCSMFFIFLLWISYYVSKTRSWREYV